MILDTRTQFASAAAVTADGVVGDVVDTAIGPENLVKDLGAGHPLYLVVKLVTAITGTTPTVTLSLRSATNAGLTGTPVDHITLPVMNDSTAVGTTFIVALPIEATYAEFLGINNVTGGTVSTGNVDANLVLDPSAWTPYATRLSDPNP